MCVKEVLLVESVEVVDVVESYTPSEAVVVELVELASMAPAGSDSQLWSLSVLERFPACLLIPLMCQKVAQMMHSWNQDKHVVNCSILWTYCDGQA